MSGGGRKKKRTWGRRLLRLLLAVVLFWCAAFAGLYFAGRAADTGGQADAMIVLGSQVLPSGEPNTVLEARLQRALEQYRTTPMPIVCCGAQGADEPLPEGDAMKNWLVRQGVPQEDVIAETRSFNTYENLENARALLPAGSDRVMIVTNSYHLPRALAIAREKGMNAVGLGGPIPLYSRVIRNYTREMLSWVKFLFLKWTNRL